MLVSIQVTTLIMEICESNKDLISSKSQQRIKKSSSLDGETILCIHCKRTASNGIRCLGMCVADNDY